VEGHPKVYQDGVQAMIDVIHKEEEVTLVAIGPLTNISKALKKDATIARKVHFVGQVGSFGIKRAAFPSWNVVCDTKAAKRVFSAPWRLISIVPYDTASDIVLSGQHWKNCLASPSTVTKALLQNHFLFANTRKGYPTDRCITLFDTAAVYLAFGTEFFHIEEKNVVVTKSGMTLFKKDKGTKMRVVMAWKDLNGFHNFLASRIPLE